MLFFKIIEFVLSIFAKAKKWNEITLTTYFYVDKIEVTTSG